MQTAEHSAIALAQAAALRVWRQALVIVHFLSERSCQDEIRILIHNSTTIAGARSSVSVSRTTRQRVLLSFVILSQDSGSFLGHLSRTHPRAFFVEAAAGRRQRPAGTEFRLPSVATGYPPIHGW